MFSPSDSVALLAQHLQIARAQTPSSCDLIARHIFEQAAIHRVPMDVVVIWIYTSNEWTTGYDFAFWVREQTGEVPLDV